MIKEKNFKRDLLSHPKNIGTRNAPETGYLYKLPY